jgi:protein-disulfide isomerase
MRRFLIPSALAAVAVAIGGLAASCGGSGAAGPTVRDGTQVSKLLAGIPQQGTSLGSAQAPVTLVEFADLQCPYCGDWARSALPDIVRRYVRPGRVRIVFAGLDFVGPDSEKALRTALAAGRQNRFWNVLELLYENQGTENAGWVSDGLLRSIGQAVPGLDVGRMLDERGSAAVDSELNAGKALATSAGVSSTPSFALGRRGGSLHVIQVTNLAAGGISPALDAALAG